MALLAVLVGVVAAFTTRRLKPALAAGLTVWALITLFLTVGVRLVDDTASDPEHALTAGFWVIQAVLLAATVGATVLTVRLRGRDTVRTA